MISVMDTVWTLFPGTMIITCSLDPNSQVSSLFRRDTFLQATTPPVLGSLETQIFKLCFT